jgi:hypothetical protein
MEAFDHTRSQKEKYPWGIQEVGELERWTSLVQRLMPDWIARKASEFS